MDMITLDHLPILRVSLPRPTLRLRHNLTGARRITYEHLIKRRNRNMILFLDPSCKGGARKGRGKEKEGSGE